MKALALTAGLGTRLRPFTDQKAKPAIPFLGIPLIHHVWEALRPLKISDLIFNLHHRPQDVRDVASLLARENSGLTVDFSDETEMILDSGGAINQVRTKLKNEKNFLVANGDEIFFLKNPEQMSDFYRYHSETGGLATLMVMEHPEVGARFGGAYADPTGKVEAFSKKSVPGFKGWHYVGVMALSERVFHYCSPSVQPENILYDVLARGMQNNERVSIFPTNMHWFEVGNPTDFVSATNSVLDLIERNPKELWVQNLTQRIRWAYLQEPLVEQSDSMTLNRVQKFLDNLKS